MSAAVSRPNGDGTPPAPVFSYAQAAKGRSPSQSIIAHASRANSDTGESVPRRTSSQQPTEGDEMDKDRTTGSSSEGQFMKEKAEITGTKANMKSSVENMASTDTTPSAPQNVSGACLQPPNSPPLSPGFGSTSTSTLPKDDDVFAATPNGSSESTWDKVSQTSQNVEKTDAKADGDEEDSKLSSWEHVPEPAQLKEAPPPAFNFWQKRALDAQAKASKEAKPLPSAGAGSDKADHLLAVKKSHEGVPGLGKVDNRKKGKAGQAIDEKPTSPSNREASKIGENRLRIADDVDRKNVVGPRVGEPMKPLVASAPPPPPGDAVSWPTPDIAQEGEKKKSQDRSEKSDKEKTPVAKPHVKEKWVPVPYVPSAVFNTPLPPGRRGGRSIRGSRDSSGRGSHVPNGSIGGAEKPLTTAASTPPTPALVQGERTRGDMGPPRGVAIAPRVKRASSAGPPTSRENRRATDPSSLEKRNESSANEQGPVQNIRLSPTEHRRTSIATQTESAQSGGQYLQSGTRTDHTGSRKQSLTPSERETGQQGTSHDHAHPRSASDRRSEGSMRPLEAFRDYNTFHARGEGRSERGRGGFRARGGYNGFSGTQAANSQGLSTGLSNPQLPPSFTSPKSHSFTERQAVQQQATNYVAPREQRGHRANSRSQSIPNSTGYTRFPSGAAPSGTPHPPALQTDIANMYGYQQPAIMSAMPYQPYLEQMQLIGMVQMQMEYYFSLDNLCKDMFLRKYMDSQGYVFLSVLTKFNRIRQLTSDIDLIRHVCRMSSEMELQTGVDGIDRVRKADGWQPWILNMEERDSIAKNDVPVQMQQLQFPLTPVFDPYRASSNVPTLSPRSPASTVAQNRVAPLAQVSTREISPPSAIPASESIPNSSNGYGSNGHFTQTPLSATVPDFTPGLQTIPNTSLPGLESHSATQNSFSDEQVENLMIVIRKPLNASAPIRAPFPSAASRTFSNGSIDNHALSDEISNVRSPQTISSANGDLTPERRDQEISQRSRSPFSFGSASKPSNSVASPVFWVKDQEAPIDDLPSDLTHESYTVFRHNALRQREESSGGRCHRDMDILYQFWSHFLIRNFNTRMYEEFRHLASDDSTNRNSTIGVRNLVIYYDESILGQKVISDDVARDYVELVKSEASKVDKFAFDKLRAALRNGALNLKNRVKIDKILDADLKAELER